MSMNGQISNRTILNFPARKRATPFVVGITGGIGAGKSIVSRILRCKGFDVYDCDWEARGLMESSESFKAWLAGEFGCECVRQGTLDRKKIARQVFGNPARLEILNRKVHAMVREDLQGWIESRGTAELLFVESAILKSSGLASCCDGIWMVDAAAETRLGRACKRDGCVKEEIARRMEAQANEYSFEPQDNARVIINDGIEPVLPRVNDLLRDAICIMRCRKAHSQKDNLIELI